MRLPDWLGHLRTDRRGRPVPYVNRWGATEKVELVAVQFDHHIGRTAAFYFDVDEPEPDFYSQNMQRQRECVVRGLCQVCGRPVPWRQRRLVISTVSTRTLQSPGPYKGWTVVSEPWLHERCALFAMRYCPALLRRQHDEDLTLIEVTSKHDISVVLTTGAIDGFPETWDRNVVIWAEIRLKTGVPVAA